MSPDCTQLRCVCGCTPVSPSHRPSTGSCHSAHSRSTAPPDQWLPPCMHPVGTPGHLLRTSPKRLSSAVTSIDVDPMTTLSGSRVIAGAAVAMSSLRSALAIAMMLGGGGTRPFAVLFGTDWIRIRLLQTAVTCCPAAPLRVAPEHVCARLRLMDTSVSALKGRANQAT